MDKLIEIAKECAASDFIGNDYRDLPKFIFTHEQLHAYTEQVCRPLVEFVREQATVDAILRIEGKAKTVLAAHTEIMGDKK